jgi:hypothetical protein
MKKSNEFDGCGNANDLLKRYKQLAMLHHPEKGGSVDVMKKIYQDYLLMLKSEELALSRLPEDQQKDLKNFPRLIKELLILDLDLEMCGSWLWISGNTFDHRDKLKELGLRYSPNKKMWYFRPSGETSNNSSPVDMEWIRSKYGSDAIPQEEEELKPMEELP